MCKCITMDKPMCSNVIKEVLLRLIRIDYPSVEEIKVTYSFVSEHSSYHVYVGVSYTDLIWEHSYSFIEYVDNLCKHIVPHPDVIKVSKLYDPINLSYGDMR